MLLKRNQTIFDTPLGYIGLYTHFSPFLILGFLYPNSSVRAFLNLGPAGNWLTLSNRGDPKVPKAVTKPITHIEGWNEMDFRSFMMEGFDGEFHFLPKGEAGNKEGGSRSMMSVYNGTLITFSEPLTVVAPYQFAENIVDSDNAPSDKDEVVLVDHYVAQKVKNRKASTSFKVVTKRKQAVFEASDIDSDPNIDEFPSAKELKDSTDCHWVVAHVVLDNVMNRRTYELMSTLKKANAACDAIREREREKDKAYVELQRQVDKLHNEYSRLLLKEKKWINYNQTFDTLSSKVECLEAERERLKMSETQLLQEIDGLKQDRVAVVSKVVPHVAMRLVRRDKIGLLIAWLIKTSLVHGRCAAFEEVANVKEPIELTKMLGYRPFSKKEFDQAGDNLATASYPF
ncbi:hypothetical protein Tco_0295012 [Tanacetum coccineum]